MDGATMKTKWTAAELLNAKFPPEYANISIGVYHVLAFQGVTACGRKVQPQQVTTVPSGRLCCVCTKSTDWFVRKILEGETP